MLGVTNCFYLICCRTTCGKSQLRKELYDTLNNYGPHLLTKVVHAHDWMTFPAALQIQQQSKKPIVLHVHSLETDRRGTDQINLAENLAFRIEQEALERADAVIAVSEYTREQISAHYGRPPSLAIPVHNAPQALESFRTPKRLKQKLVVWMGRVTHQKGTAYLLDTVPFR